jgi:pimeloyl-ACP methyl ester carboxylesterase
MATTSEQRKMIEVEGATLEIFQCGAMPGALIVSAAHPASVFSTDTAELLADTAQTGAVCINPRGLGTSTPAASLSMEQMVDDIEAIRRRLTLPRWIFWGMSGGGWLAQLYAHRHPQGLAGIIVESVCACFRERLADPTCVLSPFFPAWAHALRARRLLVEGSHTAPSSADDTEWIDIEGVGQVFRRRAGPALLVAPMPIDEGMRRALPMLWTFDSRSWLGSVGTPTLVIAGGADPVVPVHRVRAVHEAIAGSDFVVIDDAGHVPTAEQRPRVADAVRRFLAERIRP